MKKEKNKMKNEKFSGMLLVLVLAFLLVPGASARPTYDMACQNCHPAGGTVSITNVAIASATVDPGQVFNADVSWNGGSSGSTTVKWPSVAVNNNLFTFTPVQRDYTVTSGASSFAITAPSTPGTYTIRVYAVTGPNTMESDYRDITITVTVAPQPKVLTTVTISPLNPTVAEGGTLQFSAAPLDQNNAPIGASLTWASSDTANGTINSATGLFTAVKQGTTTITVTAINGSTTVTNRIVVTVTAPGQGQVLKNITVLPETAKIVVGESRTFIARTLDQFNKAISAIVTWASSNTSVGTIDSNGKFISLSEGTTTITATNGTISGSAGVIVKSPNSKNKDDEHEEHEHKEDKYKEIDHEHKGEKHGDKHEIEEDEDEFEED